MPLGVLLISSIATLFMGAGAIGLFVPELVPALAKSTVAWSLIVVGIVLDLGAIFYFVSSRSQNHSAKGAASGSRR